MFPVWEFALDEESHAGQDEATVRPYLKRPADPRDGTLIVLATFVLADSSAFDGYISPPPSNSRREIGTTHPAIVTEHDQVPFWFGMMKPKPDQIRALLATLGKQPDQVFPITYNTSATILIFGSVGGRIDGFSYLDGASAAIVKD